MIYSNSCKKYAPVPQLDRGLGYEPRRRGFESLRARQKKASILIQDWCFFQRNTLSACEIMLSHCEIASL